MQKNSIIKLSKLAVPLKSKGRFYKDKRTDLRTDFQRDRDRIIHSTAFRRLKHKTQVFVNTSGDHFRTRITHSLEVSQIARTLSKYFNLNEDLCETLSLAHDLGHTPFGHAGEDALNFCMKKEVVLTPGIMLLLRMQPQMVTLTLLNISTVMGRTFL